MFSAGFVFLHSHCAITAPAERAPFTVNRGLHLVWVSEHGIETPHVLAQPAQLLRLPQRHPEFEPE